MNKLAELEAELRRLMNQRLDGSNSTGRDAREWKRQRDAAMYYSYRPAADLVRNAAKGE